MTAESVIATLPPNSSAWPPSPTDSWGKAGNPLGNFGSLARFNAPLAARYGATAGSGAAALSDYLAKSAAASIEGHKAFLEGYSRQKYVTSTGLIQWMLNSDAPSNIWHFFHHDLTVGSAGTSAKQALSPPLHIAYDYNAGGVFLVNSLYAAAPAADLQATVEVFSVADKTLFSSSATVAAGSVASDAVADLPALKPPPPAAGTGAYFLRLTLAGAGGAIVDSNTYWLPETQDAIDWASSTWYDTPVKSYADLSALFSPALGPPRSVKADAVFAAVAPADLHSAGARWLSSQPGGAGTWTRATVTVSNPAGAGVAFLVRLRIVPTGGTAAGASDPAPLFFEDNYLVLRGGETRIVEVEFADSVMRGVSPAVAFDFGGGGI